VLLVLLCSCKKFVTACLSKRVVGLLCRKGEYIIVCPAVGTVKKIRICHDNHGRYPGWFLDKVVVEDLKTGRVYEFPCYRWLPRTDDDRKISRVLICAGRCGEVLVFTRFLPFSLVRSFLKTVRSQIDVGHRDVYSVRDRGCNNSCPVRRGQV